MELYLHDLSVVKSGLQAGMGERATPRMLRERLQSPYQEAAGYDSESVYPAARRPQ